MVTQSEIIKALNVIKRVCKEVADCSKCPLRAKEVTTLCTFELPDLCPMEWEVNDINSWRAFK